MGQINQATCTKFGTAVSTNICSKEQEQTGVGSTTFLQLIWTSSLKATAFFFFSEVQTIILIIPCNKLPTFPQKDQVKTWKINELDIQVCVF